MNLYSFFSLCFVFCSFFVGLLVWLKRLDQVGKLFFWHSICISAWGIGFTLIINSSISYEIALWVGRPANGIAAFIPTAWYHFVLALTGSLEKRKSILKILYFFASVVFLCSFTPWFIPALEPILNFSHYTTAGPLYNLLTLLYFLTVPLGFYELIKKICTVGSEKKKQLLGLLIVSLLGYLGGSLTFIPVYKIPFPQYGIFLLPIYPFGLAYVISRTNIFDMEELAQAAHRDKLTAIGVLAASINHEVRSPLFVIKGLAESQLERQREGILTEKDQIIEKGNDVLRRSIQQADRAMDIIRRLSSVAKSKIESEIKFEKVNVESALEDVLSLIHYEFASNNIALEKRIPTDLPSVEVDRRYLEEILFNLLVNATQAVKATGKAGEIRISARVEGQKVLLEIFDSGPGIPEDKIKDVFRPFYTTKEEGAGLGLYITKQLVEKINGQVNIHSAPNQGTLFTVCLLHKKEVH